MSLFYYENTYYHQTADKRLIALKYIATPHLFNILNSIEKEPQETIDVYRAELDRRLTHPSKKKESDYELVIKFSAVPKDIDSMKYSLALDQLRHLSEELKLHNIHIKKYTTSLNKLSK